MFTKTSDFCVLIVAHFVETKLGLFDDGSYTLSIKIKNIAGQVKE